jgi:hypothetical protein
VGKRKCPNKYNPWNDPYTGSPKTHKNKWKTTNFTKVVIECFYNDEDVSKAETDLLVKLDWEKDVYCLNECCGGKFSYDANRRGALTRNKLPVKSQTKEKMSIICKNRWADPNWKGKENVIASLEESQPKAANASKTPKAREAQKQAFKKSKHQQGEKNSQYGTTLIYNLDLRQTKRVKKDEPIPNGWKKGAIYDFDAYFKKQEQKEKNKEIAVIKRQQLRITKIKFYTDWYEIYKSVDFKTFCELTKYKKSQQNLCAMFKEFVEDYSPKAKNGR